MKWNVIVAWCVIAAVAIGVPILGSIRKPSAEASPAAQQMQAVQFDLMGKYVVGAGHSMGARTPLLSSLEALAKDNPGRIKVATVAGELEGRDAAVRRLAGLREDADAAAFAARYRDGTSLPADVQARYGFFGDLAAAQGKPDDDAGRAAVLARSQAKVVELFSLGAGAVLLGLTAVGLCITAIVLLALGKIQLAVRPPVGRGDVYAEAFAIYLGGFVVFGIGMGLAWPGAPFLVHAVPVSLAVVLGATWPLIRGVPLRALRQDWGLHAGRNIVVEALAGLGGYLAGLPLVVLGGVLAIKLSKLAHFDMSHPITSELTKSPVLLGLLAVVFAPITEEMLFRGAFLSHIRGWAAEGWRGALVAGGITSLVFAAIHPQGWPAIPVLGSIGFVLAMIRQWRGTLVASMAAHAFNNGVVLLVALMLLS